MNAPAYKDFRLSAVVGELDLIEDLDSYLGTLFELVNPIGFDGFTDLLGVLANHGFSQPAVDQVIASIDAAHLGHELVHEYDPQVRLLVGASFQASERLLDSLASDPLPLIRILVAVHPMTSEPVLCKLAADRSTHIAVQAAGNPYASIETLSVMRQRPIGGGLTDVGPLLAITPERTQCVPGDPGSGDANPPSG